MHRAALTAWCPAHSQAMINFPLACSPPRMQHGGTCCRIPCSVWPGWVSRLAVSPPGFWWKLALPWPNPAQPPNPFPVLDVVVFVRYFYDLVYMFLTTILPQELRLHHTILNPLVKHGFNWSKWTSICVVFTHFDSWVSCLEYGLIPIYNCKLKKKKVVNLYKLLPLITHCFGVIIYTVDAEKMIIFGFWHCNSLPVLPSDCIEFTDILSQNYDFSSL